MPLREDFRDLAYELAQKSNIEKEKIIKNSKKTLSYLKNENQKRIIKRLKRLEKEILTRDLVEINRDESDRVARVNQAIASKKGQIVDDFKKEVKSFIIQKINTNKQGYFEFLFKKITEFIPIITSDIIFYMNHQDLEYLKQNMHYLSSLNNKFLNQATFDEFDSLLGFKICALNKTFEIDFSFETLLEKNKNEIMMNFMKVFPIFEIKVKSARDILHEEIEKSGDANK
ncbi:MAG: hypothetical protein ACTSVU_06870 [Promethearchaeota archaeon]